MTTSALLAGALAWVIAANAYLAHAPDIPLPDGFTEIEEAATVFDKSSGRVISAAARGPGDADAAALFYAEALAGLGWRPEEGPSGSMAFQRGGERLIIQAAHDAAGGLRLEFSIRPTAEEPSNP